MLRHYLTVALRNLIKYRIQTVVSIIGLAVGAVSFALSGMWLRYEQTYDAFHEGADRVYVAGTRNVYNDNSYTDRTSPLPAQHLMNTFPEIESATYGQITLNFKKDESIPNDYLKVKMVDTTFTSVLPLTLLEGSCQFLYNPNEIAISRQAAREIFGDESPVGKPGPLQSTTITAVVEGWEHSNYGFDYVAKRTFHDEMLWQTSAGQTLLRVVPGADITALKKKLENMEVVDNEGKKMKYPVSITPLSENHYTHPDRDVSVRIEHIRLFCITGLLIVASALSNYLIMFLIRVRIRLREWALRKVNGASDTGLLLLLVTELVLLLSAAFLIGLLLMEIVLPHFKSLSGIAEGNPFFYKETAVYMSVVLCFALSFVWAVLFFQRRLTLQSAISSRSAKSFTKLFRRTGLWLQLGISIGLVFCTVVMMKQLHHLCTSPDMGLTHPDVAFVREVRGITRHDYEDWIKKMREIPGIEFREVADMLIPVGTSPSFLLNDWEGKQTINQELVVKDLRISQEAFNLLGLQLIEGVFPEVSHDKESIRVLVNESFVKEVGWKEPVGKRFAKKYIVCGVLKDVRTSPRVQASPAMFSVNRASPSYTNVLIFDGSYKEARQTINTYIRKTYPDFDFTLVSFGQMMEELLVSERTLMKLLSAASFVCVIIAIFGVFSLVSLSCEQRRKEIAIRKVHGASLKDIIAISIREYVILLALAAIAAFPVGYIIMKPWSETYVIQTPVSWWLYAAILSAIAFIIFSCIGRQIWQAAQRNPAEEIKTE